MSGQRCFEAPLEGGHMLPRSRPDAVVEFVTGFARSAGQPRRLQTAESQRVLACLGEPTSVSGTNLRRFEFRRLVTQDLPFGGTVEAHNGVSGSHVHPCNGAGRWDHDPEIGIGTTAYDARQFEKPSINGATGAQVMTDYAVQVVGFLGATAGNGV